MAANATHQSLNDVIDKLQSALDDARYIPGWGVALVVVVALLCIIILLHVLALIATGPCLWALWVRRARLRRERLMDDDDDIMDPDKAERGPTPDTAAPDDRSK